MLAHGTLCSFAGRRARRAAVDLEAALLQAFFHTHVEGGCQLASHCRRTFSQGVIGLLCYVMPAELAASVHRGMFGPRSPPRWSTCRARAELDASSRCSPACPLWGIRYFTLLNYLAALPALCWGIGFCCAIQGRGVSGACVPLVRRCHVFVSRHRGRHLGGARRRASGGQAVARPCATRAARFVPVVWLIGYIGERRAEGASVL